MVQVKFGLFICCVDNKLPKIFFIDEKTNSLVPSIHWIDEFSYYTLYIILWPNIKRTSLSALLDRESLD